jgi:cytochrome c peroxidase
MDNVIRAIASYERTLISGRSAFDRYVFDDERTALSDSARRGMALFYSERIGCGGCHFGINFSGPIVHAAAPRAAPLLANTGLYNVDGHGRYPDADRGLERITHRRSDNGKFRVPTLRNVALTAPYMHDGSIATLGEVIDHYAAGGRQLPAGPRARNDYKDKRITGFTVSAQEKADLVAFLDSLSD